jgi:hypothetical protein
MWSSSGARSAAPSGAPALARAPDAQRRIVLVEPLAQSADEHGPVKARMRVTLETLSAVSVRTELRPGEDVAVAIQEAAAKAGRSNWYTADWNGDGRLDSADVAAFAAAYRAGLTSADLNHDGKLDMRDFAEFLREFREGESRPVAVKPGGLPAAG